MVRAMSSCSRPKPQEASEADTGAELPAGLKTASLSKPPRRQFSPSIDFQRIQIGRTTIEVDPRDPNLCSSFPLRCSTSSSTIYSPRPR